MNVLDLFSGIGGFSLGLERAGMRTVAFCEIEPYCRAVLRKHWPGVPIYEDVRNLTADQLRADGIIPDVICGGFPCQDISLVGRAVGLEGKRSGLWHEYARLIAEVSPRWVIIENVSALRGRGLGTILGQVSALGYDAEWHCLPASALGAHHERDRIWIIANATRLRRRRVEPGREALWRDSDAPRSSASGTTDAPQIEQLLTEQSLAGPAGEIWRIEPELGRLADGLPARVHRLRALGNAVVPQVAQIIGEAIMRRKTIETATTKYTEGPWDRDEGDNAVYAWDTSGGAIPLLSTHPDFNGLGTDDEATANATLAASAPDMLAALNLLLQAFEKFTREANWAQSALSADTIRLANEAPGVARAAILKATSSPPSGATNGSVSGSKTSSPGRE